MPQLNLQLGGGQVQPSGTRSGNAPVGQGSLWIGKGLGDMATALYNQSKQELAEDPTRVFEWYAQKSAQMDTLEQELKSTYQDYDQFALASEETTRQLGKQLAQEARQLGIPKKGTEKLFPRFNELINSLGKHRTSMALVAGQSKLEQLRETFKSNLAGTQLVIDEKVVDQGQDGEGITGQRVEATIKLANQNKVVSDLYQFSSSAYDIGRKYLLPQADVQKFLGESREGFFQVLQNQAIATIPEKLIDPRYNHLNFTFEQVFIDPTTGEQVKVPKKLDATEMSEMRKAAHAEVRARQQREDEIRQERERVENNLDAELASDLMVKFPTFGTVTSLMDAIQHGTSINGEVFQFKRADNKEKFLSKLREIKSSGGFARESDQDTLNELTTKAVVGDLTNPLELIESIPLLSGRDYNNLMEMMVKNRGEQKSDYQRNLKEQLSFSDDFWGNFTNYVGVFDQTASALSLVTKSKITNRANSLPIEKRTREALIDITHQVILEEAQAAVKSKFNISQVKFFQQLSRFENAGEIEKNVKNGEDKKLAYFLLELKKYRLEKEAEKGESTSKPQTSGEFMDDIFGKAKQAINDFLGKIGLGL